MRYLCVLGSTGSIGENTLDVVRQHPDKYCISSLSANTQIEKLASQCLEFRPEIAVVSTAELATKLRDLLGESPTTVMYGLDGLIQAVRLTQVDTVMAAIVGAAGLLPTLEAAKLGKRVLLANKEALVMSGELMINLVRQSGAELLPIDSEHNAIFQCLPQNQIGQSSANTVKELLLTASGGPFLHRELNSFPDISPAEACKHPNWVMGRKISVDSATMMNKGLELIEAMWLFDTSPEKIKVVIHPQSIIHSMVRYIDGSIIAQLGAPDMRTPIAYGLGWPNRISSGVQELDFEMISNLSFHALEDARFPLLKLARAVAGQGGTAPTIMNAANEIAVAAFLNNQIQFTQINEVVDTVLNTLEVCNVDNLEIVLETDKMVRDFTNKHIQTIN
ncbi:1-deoxy-D-xylulose-5-phosphate reductoisomerase [Polynucleobacter kasalickyi]|uniref:1-deoxy-D-xylulose 5-phosphate reductoisomerase n=1 Tax=Polynucleobacter kasalickyi TaxID=1938817 RepID=A0A1W1ZCS2_9BURK|nr:1-deoxy-D-xylulose-5-phosphate reductoisomerase [Polynucleobacter kasalickyi]SMC46136.1 1-deoxy-D-xylulose 5-phosphate reductoisomerase [Polynucleobacter kasalickyi]